jgi:hypothetical protein
VSLPLTGPDGEIVAKNLRKDSIHNLWFRKAGYFDAYAQLGEDLSHLGVTSDTSDTEWKAAASLSSRPIIVPMYRGTSTRPTPVPPDWK